MRERLFQRYSIRHGVVEHDLFATGRGDQDDFLVATAAGVSGMFLALLFDKLLFSAFFQVSFSLL